MLLLHAGLNCQPWMLTQAVQVLALGRLPRLHSRVLYQIPLRPLPASMSQLSQLRCLLLHNVVREYAPGGLPHLPQVCSACSGFRNLHDGIVSTSALCTAAAPCCRWKLGLLAGVI